jgi:beta-galactosidase/beta-glucuronidase
MHERREGHPRPQLVRDGWIDLCGPWQFAHDDGDVGVREGWATRREPFTRTIQVPFPPESRASGVHEPGFHPVVWYRRSFTVTAEQRAGGLLLHFGAVDYRAQVWVNGQLVAQHEGGHTPFSAEIGGALRAEGEQEVVVRAEDRPDDLAQPRGKQDWELHPHRIWYHRTTGIWQPVWLEPVPHLHIAELRWTPDLDRGLLGLQVRLSAPPPRPVTLRIQLSLRGAPLADDTVTLERSELRREIALDSGAMTMSRERLLWSPRFPNLVDAVLTLHDGEQQRDQVLSYAGLRSVGAEGGRFLLNGRPYYLRLVLAQNYWPESHLAAPNDAALRREVELAKELGFNGVRIHQKVEDPRFLYWCDRLGLLVWGEMANAYVFSAAAVERLTREWLEVLRRDYNHPCIIAWVPLNESWGVPDLARAPAQQAYAQGLYHLTKALDPTRLAIANDGWEHLVGDIFGVHDYALDGETLRERYGTAETLARTLTGVQPHYRTIVLPRGQRTDQPVMLTEWGGISYAPDPGRPFFGYGTVPDTAAYLAKYADLVTAILDSPVVAGFCYTQLTDTEQETNGLLTAERAHKLDPAAVRALNTRASRAIPAELISNLQVAQEITAFQGTGSSS